MTLGGKQRRPAPGSERIGSQRGFSLLELMVVIIVISVLATVLFDRLQRYQELAEKTAMEITIMNLRSGLRLRVAELMIQDRMQEIASLAQENPVKWLDAPPPNYIGQADDAEPAIAPGSWYFDSRRRELVYIPRRTRFFQPGADREMAVRLRVTVVAQPQPNSNGAPPRAEGVALRQTNQYHWFE